MKLRKLMAIFFVIAVTAVVLQACCKAYCSSQTFNLRFINYKIADIDTVLFTKYVANGKFDQKLDSVLVYTYYNQSDTIYSGFTQNVEFDKDWIIRIPNTGKEYHITEIGTTNERCTCTNNTYKALSSYRLDGVLNTSDYFDLKK